MFDILITEKSPDYELLDSGGGEKLERFGEVVTRRPDPQAIWFKSLPESEWKKAKAVFIRTGTFGKWKTDRDFASGWNISFGDLKFELHLLPSKHLGIFPEQVLQWGWLEEKIKNRKSKIENQKIRVLNLFGYTGGASLVCARAGADVCHVDSSKFAVDLAHTNLELSGLEDKPVRFIVDDVRKFIEREIKRGVKYDIIIMDPPVYGKGAKKEVWKIENDLMPFLSRVKNLLSKDAIAFLINGYSSGYSAITYSEMLKDIMLEFDGKISFGELALRESSANRLLNCGIFARWQRE